MLKAIQSGKVSPLLTKISGGPTPEKTTKVDDDSAKGLKEPKIKTVQKTLLIKGAKGCDAMVQKIKKNT